MTLSDALCDIREFVRQAKEILADKELPDNLTLLTEEELDKLFIDLSRTTYELTELRSAVALMAQTVKEYHFGGLLEI